MKRRKGIILAGGSGTRIYPLSVLMLSGIREVAIITTPEDQTPFKRLLSDGTQWGISFTFIVQPNPDGLTQTYLLAEEFLDGAPSALVLGDNIFFGHGLTKALAHANNQTRGGTVFAYQVSDPERYGVVEFKQNGYVTSIIEKPEFPASNFAVTGLYFLDETASERAKLVRPSARGELEITSLLNLYLTDGQLEVKKMGRGYAWLDTGTHSSLLDAGNFVRTLENRQGLQVGSPDEIAFKQGWIDKAQLQARARLFEKSSYGEFLTKISK